MQVTRLSSPFVPGAGRRLLSGIDTLAIGYYGQVRPELLEELKQAKTEAGSGRDAIVWIGPTQFAVPPKARPFYQYVAHDGRWIAAISDWQGDHPQVHVRFRSHFLWSVGPDEAVRQAEEWLTQYVFTDGIEKHVVSRVDLCADFAEVPEAERVLSDTRLVVSRARDRRTYAQGTRASELAVGSRKGQGIMCRVYDKALEIQDRKGEKAWFWEAWGLEPGAYDCVVRVEFQVGRDALREAGIDTWQDLQESAQELWRYLTEDWLRFCELDDVRQNRRTVLAWWGLVQQAWVAWQVILGPFVRDVRARANREYLIRTARGYLVSIAAWGDGLLESVLNDLRQTFGKTEWEERVRYRRVQLAVDW